MICLPGVSKDFEQKKLMEIVRLAVELHKIKEVHIIHHEDCGAYRLAGFQKEHEFSAQQADMEKAKRFIYRTLPSTKG